MSPESLELLKFLVQFGVFGIAIFTAWTGFDRAHKDRRAALEQSKRDLRWRQTVEAQAAIRRMTGDPIAQNAMTMLDWNARHFQIRENLRERISWDDMRLALRAEPGRFSPVEVFVRDSFDALFDHFQMIQQEITNEIFNTEDVVYPIGYYARRIKHPKNWQTFDAFLTKYDYLLAKRLIETSYRPGVSSGEEDDIDAALLIEEIAHDVEMAVPS
jgi:hypothetical protein